MGNFLELRFGQAGLNGEMNIQRELVPIKAIQDAYIILPEKRNIKIKWKVEDKIWSRVEYYRNEIDCLKRWTVIKHVCGIRAKLQLLNPVPLPMDVEEMESMKKGEEE